MEITTELVLKIIDIFLNLEYSGYSTSNYGFALKIKEILDVEYKTSNGQAVNQATEK